MLQNVTLNSPWYFYVLCPILAFAASFWLYYKHFRNKELQKNAVRGLFVLRFLSLSILLFLLLNIFLKQVENQTENPVILFAVDNSNSMVSAKDSAFIRGKFLAQCESLKERVGERFEIKPILFGEAIKQSSMAPEFSEKETDLDNLFREIENNYSGQNVGALVIASDGIYTRGAHPIQSAARLGFPVYAIACGDTSQNKDALVQKVNHNQIAYLGNNFPVEIITAAKLLRGKELLVKVFSNDKLLSEQRVAINSDNYSGAVTFTITASGIGMTKYNVSIEPVAGEKNIANNSRMFFVEVIDNRDKILLLADAPHPDISAIKEALSGFNNYELEFGQYAAFNKPFKAYSLVIMHGLSNLQAGILTNCLNSQVPVWIINPLNTENLPGLKLGNSMGRSNDAEPYLNKSFGLFGISDEFKKFTAALPAVKTPFGSYGLNNGGISLINQKIGSIETENPILLFNELNGLKSALFIGDGLWRWKLRDFVEHKNHNLFNELIGKTVQYLAVKSDKSFFRVSPPKVVNENEAIEFSAEVYNKSYEAVTIPDVNLLLTNSKGDKFNYTFSKTSHAYHLNIGRLSPGDYTYETSVKAEGQLYTKKGRLSVLEVVAEKINTVANHALLFQLTNRNGGRLFYPEEMKKLEETLLSNETIKPITYSQSSVTSIINLKWLLLLAVVLLATEWIIRKRHLHI